MRKLLTGLLSMVALLGFAGVASAAGISDPGALGTTYMAAAIGMAIGPEAGLGALASLSKVPADDPRRAEWKKTGDKLLAGK